MDGNLLQQAGQQIYPDDGMKTCPLLRRSVREGSVEFFGMALFLCSFSALGGALQIRQNDTSPCAAARLYNSGVSSRNVPYNHTLALANPPPIRLIDLSF